MIYIKGEIIMAHTHYVAYPAVLEDSENDTGTYTVTQLSHTEKDPKGLIYQ